MKRWWAKSPIWSFPDGRWRQCDVSSEPFHTWVETEQSKRQPKRRYITSHKDQFSLATKHYSMTKKKAIWDAVAAQVTHHQFYRFDFWNIQGATNLFKMYALGQNIRFLSKSRVLVKNTSLQFSRLNLSLMIDFRRKNWKLKEKILLYFWLEYWKILKNQVSQHIWIFVLKIEY